MQITMLGTGAALPDPNRSHSSILITVEGEHYLIDCGHDATRQLVRANIKPEEVNTVFLSHLHYDHIADFPYFAISTWMCNRKKKPLVLGPEGTQEFIDHSLENGAFAIDIKARAQFKQRKETMEMIRPEVKTLTTGLVFEDEHVKVYAEYVQHIPSDITQCYGFRFETKDKIVAFSGDTAPCESLYRLAENADLLINDCSFPQVALDYREKVGIGTSAHTSPIELGKLAKEANVKSVVATHFAHFDTTSPIVKGYLSKHMPIDLVGPDMLDQVVQDVRKNYDGPFRLAHDLMRIDL